MFISFRRGLVIPFQKLILWIKIWLWENSVNILFTQHGKNREELLSNFSGSAGMRSRIPCCPLTDVEQYREPKKRFETEEDVKREDCGFMLLEFKPALPSSMKSIKNIKIMFLYY